MCTNYYHLTCLLELTMRQRGQETNTEKKWCTADTILTRSR